MSSHQPTPMRARRYTSPSRFKVIVDEPQADEIPIHEALQEWAAWARVRPAVGRALSAEGNFTPPLGNLYDPPAPNRAFDIPRCELINTALLHIPSNSRRAIIMRYFYRYPDNAMCRRLRIHHGNYQGFMRHARLMLARRCGAILERAIEATPNLETLSGSWVWSADGKGQMPSASACAMDTQKRTGGSGTDTL